MMLNRQRRVRLALSPLKEFLERVREELRLNGREVSVCFVSDRVIARMNSHFRGKQGTTDVLSFSSDCSDILGDIAISPETARRNARRFGRALPEELRVLILHGVLHLMGYDHETDRGQMDRIERRLRRRLGLS